MRNNLSITFSILLLGSLALHVTILSGCQPQPKQHPQGRQIIGSQPSLALVEKQLLTTITNAEKLERGNPLLLSSLYSLASYYQDRKEYDKAANQYQRALTIKEQISGPNHPDIVEILQRYARILQAAQRPTEAANLLARVDAILTPSPALPTTQ